ncbi:TadE/TadG family type IV pilus assembly protein [Burkholderia pyrrocinia]|uniref:TadE/TadG family type IV pilus assembly protein n=1 Tax=Burkholderia pyrrocinia TaxID=60550 RepID=UPI00104D996C|nr:hypothetical protein [Burkholderia pyrrocinia]TDA47472.1 hypothetical protein EVG18_10680 [Burkholderia pyrrocinia]
MKNRSARKGRAGAAGESGQALVPALIFLLLGGIGLFVAFNSFQISSAKIKMQNTADAAAYSVAVLQARDYNYSAYLNRAMVANQATAAQMVSMKSAVDMLYGVFTPGISGQLVAQYGRGDIATNMLNRRNNTVAPIRDKWTSLLPEAMRSLDEINRSLSGAEYQYHQTTLSIVPGFAESITGQNDPYTHVSAGAFFDDAGESMMAAWRSYTTQFDPHTGSTDRFADVATDKGTLDGFTRIRGRSWFWIGLKDYCGNDINLEYTGSGGTQLRPDRGGWQALDGSMTKFSVAAACDKTDPPLQPISWTGPEGMGGAGNGNYLTYESWQGYGGYLNFGRGGSVAGNVPSAMKEQYDRGPGESLYANSELWPYNDVTVQSTDNAASPITVRIERDSSTLVRDQRLQGGGRMKVRNDNSPLMAMASGQAYFSRPNEKGASAALGLMMIDHISGSAKQFWTRADGKTEYASLFSPYWDARLAPLTDAQRTALSGIASPSGADARGGLNTSEDER